MWPERFRHLELNTLNLNPGSLLKDALKYRNDESKMLHLSHPQRTASISALVMVSLKFLTKWSSRYEYAVLSVRSTEDAKYCGA